MTTETKKIKLIKYNGKLGLYKPHKNLFLTNKSLRGQFFTTNYKYILSNLFIPDNITKIIEPFCGNGDLLNFIDIQ